ncbi:WD40 repeat domain-containing protein, partial [Glycomyces sp. NPDC048151]|uniref:WD40 repeat domain-containing protein n=1 Tax=Glycomyces sp. NPDC048151 TaxID=3364002 RepID=UPI00371A3127
GSEDETVRVWDLTSGSQRATFDGHDDAVNAVAFGEIDGTPVVISGSEDETVRVWDLTSGSQRATFDGHDDAVNAVAFGEVDGMPIAVSGGTDRSVRVWNLATMRQIQAFHGHAGRVLRIEICWVAGQPMVVSESEDESIRIWELRGPDGSAEVSVDDTKQTGSPQENKVDSIVFGTLGGDGVVFGGGEDGSVRAWDLLDGSERAVMRGHDGPVSTVAYGHIGGTPVLVSGGQDRTVQVWDLVQQKRRSTHQAHDHWVSNVAFGEIAGRPLATSTGGDGAIRIWDLRRRKLAAAFQDPLPWVRSVAFGAVAGQPCFIGGGQDGVQAWGFKPRLGWLNRRWSPRAPRALMSFDGDEESDRPQVAFGEIDGTTVILYGRLDGSVVCFRPEDPTDKVVLEGHKDLVTALAFGKISDRPIVVTGSRDLSVRIWDLRDRREIDRLEIGALVRSVALAAPGTVVVSAGTEVICFDVPSLQAIAEGRAEGR